MQSQRKFNVCSKQKRHSKKKWNVWKLKKSKRWKNPWKWRVYFSTKPTRCFPRRRTNPGRSRFPLELLNFTIKCLTIEGRWKSPAGSSTGICNSTKTRLFSLMPTESQPKSTIGPQNLRIGDSLYVERLQRRSSRNCRNCLNSMQRRCSRRWIWAKT